MLPMRLLLSSWSGNCPNAGTSSKSPTRISSYPFPKGSFFAPHTSIFFSSRFGNVFNARTGWKSNLHIMKVLLHPPFPLNCDVAEERDYYLNTASILYSAWNPVTKQAMTEGMKFQGELQLSLICTLCCKGRL